MRAMLTRAARRAASRCGRRCPGVSSFLTSSRWPCGIASTSTPSTSTRRRWLRPKSVPATERSRSLVFSRSTIRFGKPTGADERGLARRRSRAPGRRRARVHEGHASPPAPAPARRPRPRTGSAWRRSRGGRRRGRARSARGAPSHGLRHEAAQPLGQVHGRPDLVVEVARQREEVDRVLDEPALQVVAHLERDVGAHALLRLRRRRAHVRRRHHARVLGERASRRAAPARARRAPAPATRPLSSAASSASSSISSPRAAFTMRTPGLTLRERLLADAGGASPASASCAA